MITRLKVYLDGKLLRFAWYRKFQAKRSRVGKTEDSTKDDIEVYVPTIPQSEVDRMIRVKARRELQELEFQTEENERNADEGQKQSDDIRGS